MEGGCRIKLRIFKVASWLWLWFIIITATVAQTQNTTDPAEGLSLSLSLSLSSLYIYLYSLFSIYFSVQLLSMISDSQWLLLIFADPSLCKLNS
ncbi:hypothetical protein HanRHA438_Chr11g0496551 [Helianthus annuus]|nr:hypothetical protein HanRHA438_Chr11g0496551 [Helianthus annuus]